MDAPRRRQRVFGAAAVVLAAAVGAVLPVAPVSAAGRHSSPGGPQVTISPAAGLADGQVIQVTGSHFSGRVPIGLVECLTGATGPSTCDLSNTVEVRSSGSGKFSTTFIVSRLITVNGVTTDCVTPGACILGVGNVFDYAEAVGVPLAFDPSLPLAPPLQIGATVSPTNTVYNNRGIVALTGTVTCNRPAQVQLNVTLRQVYHRAIFYGGFSSPVRCLGPSGPWNGKVFPQNGLFTVGNATVALEVFASADGTTAFGGSTTKVALQK
ncbi:MAG TPA: neocarzinostatin apoprotein domain-containing protein [Acidimicrobiales bacterium]|nr:neocarzinostatin apoprotein domain-containing protein [Acidimicrobiales bacterium]